MKIRKDGGLVVPFDPGKIRQAVYKALAGTGLPSESIAEKVTVDVVAMLGEDKEVVDNKEVQDCVEKALMRRDLGDAAKAYILYRDMRAKSRARLRVLYPGVSKPSITDRSLLLFQSASQNETSSWDRSRITERLMATLDMPNYKAAAIAKEVEDRVIASGIRTVSSSLIRELVNNILESEGVPGRLNDMAAYQVPREFIDSLLKSKSNENSNIVSNNPEAVNLTLAEFILKQYALDTVYSEDVKRAHMSGMIYIHDLGYPHRVYCSSHSIEYIKKFGLKLLNNLNTESNPARSASVLTGHLNTFLASMQANYAGALGLGYINILYAPMLLGMDKKSLHQIAQELVFNGSQNAFSRGGQSLHPDELIWVKRNGKYQSVKIGKFVDAFIEAHPESVRHTDEYEVYNTETENIQAISFEKAGGNVLDKPIMYVARMPHKGKMYRVHTSNGIVNITGDHSLFTFNGKGDIRPTKTKDLKKGDFVVIPHKVNLEGRQTHVNILDYLPEDWLAVHGASKVFDQIQAKGKPSKVLLEAGATRYIMKDAKKSDKVRASLAGMFMPLADCELGLKGDSPAHVPAKLALTQELGYVAGMFCAEGHNVHRKVVISNTSPELLYKVAANLDRMQYSWYRYNHGLEQGMTTDQVEINGILGAFLQKACTDGRRKVVPDWVFTAPDCCVEAFLEGFYDGEGSNRKNKPDEWSVSNTSTRVVAGISLLLLSRGRETHIYESNPANSAWNACYEVRESAERKVNPFTEHTTVNGYETYKNHINAETREAVDWFIGSDLSVSIVKNIEEYEYEGYVYDISVPGTEAFLGGIGNVFFKNTLFLDFNIHTGVPSYLREVPAIGPGGKYMFRKDDGTVIPLKEDVCVSDADNEWLLYYEDGDKFIQVLSEEDGKQVFGENVGGKVLTYGDFEKEAQQFAHALLDVWCEGDARGRVFEFPKCDFHVNKDTFETEGQLDVLKHACRVAAINGSPYFVFDRDSVSIASCCFTGNTKVLVRGGEGGGIHLTTFKELAEARYNDMRMNMRVFHNGGWSEARLLELSGEGKPIYRITTVNHKVQEVTCDHIVPTANGDKRADQVTADDYILFSTRVTESVKANGNLNTGAMTYAQGVIIGAYLGDGSMEQRQVNWTPTVHMSWNAQKYETLLPYYKQALADWGITADIKLHTPYNNVYPVYVVSRELHDAIRAWVTGDYGHEKNLNINCLRESSQFRKGIIDGYYATDGGNSNRIYTTSAALVETMEAVFTSLGVQTIVDVSDRTGEGKVEIRGEQYNRNYPVYCIRWYENGTRRQYSGLYITRNNSVYYKVASIEKLPARKTVYCFEIKDNNEPYFTLPNGIITHNCRLRVQITDMSLLRHPERLRTCGAQNVTINIPQAAYRAAKNGHRDYDGICGEIDKAMDLAVQAHLQKKASIESMMKGPGDVLWQLGQPSCDGRPYLDMNDATYIIGLIGVNDAVQYLTGKQMHESDEAFDLALRITSHMFLRTKEYTKRHGIQFKLEESPAESAARRLARSDLQRFREDALQVYKGGDEEHAYYTNSIHIVANADVDSIERIDKQSMFNSLIEAGAITHLFTGDKANDPGAIETLVTQTYLRTQCAQLTISPEFTYCNTCGHKSAGIKDKCDRCGSSNVVGETRIVGYYSKVHSWNDSKKAELKDRQRGNYAVKSVEGLQ